ncbi:MAG: permease-like cell division protein FtsX [Actinomycetia bacterium]|nr:permease-like cell division protein FtsX [Actinomycetes bacterium]
MHSVTYFIREAFSGFRRNLSTVVGAVVTIFLSLLVIGAFTILTLVVNKLMGSVESQVSITIFLDDKAGTADIQALQDFIKSQPYVGQGPDGVVFVTKEQAMENFKEFAGPNYANTLSSNPLPPSIQVKLSEPAQVQVVVDQIVGNEIFNKIKDPDSTGNSIRYGQGTVEKLFDFFNIVRISCLVLVILLVFVALIFINNTIRLAIFARRKEIAIMRLVGASNGFIRGPFLMEGFFQALIGAALAIFTISVAMGYLVNNLKTNIPMLTQALDGLPLNWVYLLLLLVGVIIGLFGSIWAMRRYLRV